MIELLKHVEMQRHSAVQCTECGVKVNYPD